MWTQRVKVYPHEYIKENNNKKHKTRSASLELEEGEEG